MGRTPLKSYLWYGCCMLRLARTVFAKVPHHITQRGNRREDIFLTDDDREIFLAWLEHYCQQHGADILAYCLMPNYLHLVAVPVTEVDLERVFKPFICTMRNDSIDNGTWRFMVWQGRYFSGPLGDPYLWATIRYVDRNPVRARLVRKAERYPWSSAAIVICGPIRC